MPLPAEPSSRHDASRQTTTWLLATVAVAATAAFAAVAARVLEGTTQPLDEWVLRGLRRPDDPATPIGPPWLHEAGRDLTALGGGAAMLVVAASVTGYLLMRRRRLTAALVAFASGGAIVISFVLKDLYARPRPQIVPHLSMAVSSSFPSGHSMTATAVYLTLGWLLANLYDNRAVRAYILSLAVVVTLLIGISRVYMGVHYPTDVIAGWAAGLAWATFCQFAVAVLHERGIRDRTFDDSADAMDDQTKP